MQRTIPPINHSRLVELATRIKPLVVRPEGLSEIETPGSLRGVSFLWAPKPLRVVGPLQHLGVVLTYHTWGYYGLFKPSVAEVLTVVARHPGVDQVTHFWLNPDSVQRPGEPLLYEPDDNEPDGYHRAEVTLYREVV